MTDDPEWHPAFRQLAQAGVHIRLYPDSSGDLYIHAKAMVADAGLPGQQVLVGSENFSAASAATGNSASVPLTQRRLPPSTPRWPATTPGPRPIRRDRQRPLAAGPG